MRTGVQVEALVGSHLAAFCLVAIHCNIKPITIIMEPQLFASVYNKPQTPEFVTLRAWLQI